MSNNTAAPSHVPLSNNAVLHASPLLALPDEALERILYASDPYTAIALTQTCAYLNARFDNELFWKLYSLPLRQRHCQLGKDVDDIKERSFAEYVMARARAFSAEHRT